MFSPLHSFISPFWPHSPFRSLGLLHFICASHKLWYGEVKGFFCLKIISMQSKNRWRKLVTIQVNGVLETSLLLIITWFSQPFDMGANQSDLWPLQNTTYPLFCTCRLPINLLKVQCPLHWTYSLSTVICPQHYPFSTSTKTHIKSWHLFRRIMENLGMLNNIVKSEPNFNKVKFLR